MYLSIRFFLNSCSKTNFGGLVRGRGRVSYSGEAHSVISLCLGCRGTCWGRKIKQYKWQVQAYLRHNIDSSQFCGQFWGPAHQAPYWSKMHPEVDPRADSLEPFFPDPAALCPGQNSVEIQKQFCPSISFRILRKLPVYFSSLMFGRNLGLQTVRGCSQSLYPNMWQSE